MRALVYTGPETLEMQDVPAPVGQDTIITVSACGICGSDMHAYLGHDARRPPPFIFGHEIAGQTPDGRRVTVNPLVACGRCVFCKQGRENICEARELLSMPPRPGGFAEQVAVPERNLILVPDSVPLEIAALVEPLACGWHAVRLAADALFTPIEDTACLVQGGGAIGVGAALALLDRGATDVTVVEPNDARRKMLEGTLSVPVQAQLTGTPGLIIDAVGIAATREAAFAAIAPGGVIAHIGLGSGEGGVDARRATLQEITFFGTYTYTAQDFRDTATALFEGRLPMAGHYEERPLEDGATSFAALKNGLVATPKIVLRP